MEIVTLLPLIIILGVFVIAGQRRNRKAMQATIDLHESLRVGDRIHTTSGLQATIAAITDDTVELEIAPGIVTTWMKLAIRDKIEPEVEAPPTATEITDSDTSSDPGR